MRTGLGRSQHIGRRFNRTGAQQRLPMGGACDGGKGRWDQQDLRAGLGQSAVQIGKSDIITNAQPDFGKGCVSVLAEKGCKRFYCHWCAIGLAKVHQMV